MWNREVEVVRTGTTSSCRAPEVFVVKGEGNETFGEGNESPLFFLSCFSSLLFLLFQVRGSRSLLCKSVLNPRNPLGRIVASMNIQNATYLKEELNESMYYSAEDMLSTTSLFYARSRRALTV